MYETPLVEILVPLLIVGIPLTMISSYIFVEMPKNTADGDQRWQMASAEGVQKREDLPVPNDVDEQRGMIALRGYVPDVYLVSTSWAWGVPRTDPTQGALDHDQGRQRIPSTAPPACVIAGEGTGVEHSGAEQAA